MAFPIISFLALPPLQASGSLRKETIPFQDWILHFPVYIWKRSMCYQRRMQSRRESKNQTGSRGLLWSCIPMWAHLAGAHSPPRARARADPPSAKRKAMSRYSFCPPWSCLFSAPTMSKVRLNKEPYVQFCLTQVFLASVKQPRIHLSPNKVIIEAAVTQT